ncbi:DUF3604 domain-containing protein [Myxococcota bacterium]|nr:DUF3604 domain-containing protein [Myxococcota bacterium]
MIGQKTFLVVPLILGVVSASMTSGEIQPSSSEQGIGIGVVPVRPYRITEEREACTDYQPFKRPFFGDTHVHTTFSFDANVQDTRNPPSEAYAFARGAKIGIQPYDGAGIPTRFVQLDRPLDFTALSDHSELLGEVRMCNDPEFDAYENWVCWGQRNSRMMSMVLFAGRVLQLKSRWGFCGQDGELCRGVASQVWQEVQRAAEEAYDRTSACEFTSFIGYEWTAGVGTGDNLHRNVIFRNEDVPDYAVSWIDTPSAHHLWERLDEECTQANDDCEVLTIPHNSNISGGWMFGTAKIEEAGISQPVITAEEAMRRARFEPIVELTQHKGASECDVVAGWSNDEFCDFETLPYDSFGGGTGTWFAPAQLPDANNFVRWALTEGLRQQDELGVNGLKFGMIGSTDSHIAAPGLTAENSIYPGHGGFGKGGGAETPTDFADNIEFNPGGLAVVWAEENTRDSIFNAMLNKETYATSGTRPILRFFGGWEYPDELCSSHELAATGYAKGVPMGGDLPPRPGGVESPRFVVSALRDSGAGGGALQRIQIIKGWIEEGEHREAIYDVAGGDNGASVDLMTCEPRGKGASSLCSVWTDPDFDPSRNVFYYARVLENPSCRWSQYTCNAAGVNCGTPEAVPEGLAACCSEEHKGSIQERAWTSPIWYTP